MTLPMFLLFIFTDTPLKTPTQSSPAINPFFTLHSFLELLYILFLQINALLCPPHCPSMCQSSHTGEDAPANVCSQKILWNNYHLLKNVQEKKKKKTPTVFFCYQQLIETVIQSKRPQLQAELNQEILENSKNPSNALCIWRPRDTTVCRSSSKDYGEMANHVETKCEHH